jgi:hypothetical protein
MRNVMSTKKATRKSEPDQMRPEYDLRGGVRGKYFEEYQKGTNLVLLAPDVARSFPDSNAVNEALRKVISEKRVAQKRAKRGAG